VAETVDANSIRPPSVFVVGEVVRRAPGLSWFSARPLFGARILVPSSQATGERLRHRLSALGADVLLRPVLLARDPEDWAPLDAALDDLDSYDWLVFTSGNGVDYLLKRLTERGKDVRSLGGLEIAVVGQGTAERLAAHGVSADRVPEEFSSEGLARALVDEAEGKRFLVARTTRGRQVLAPALERAGGEVLQVVAYESVDVKDPDPEVSELLTKGEIDWIVVTSSATARALDDLYGEDLGSARLASISPLTSGELREIGHEATVEASPHTVDGVVSAILNSHRRGA
jgi:uroporphyrinogen III methyltransferase/synthase